MAMVGVGRGELLWPVVYGGVKSGNLTTLGVFICEWFDSIYGEKFADENFDLKVS